MGVKVQMEGLDEFRAAMRNLPETLKAEAATIVDAYAREAANMVIAAYPQGPTGNLKRGVHVTHNAGRRFIAESIVKSSAPHAPWFEAIQKGWKPRSPRRTKSGANRGTMPIAPESQQAIPIFIRVRTRMRQALIELVKRQGFEVAA